MAPELRAVRLPASDRKAPPRERPGWDDYFLGVAQAVSRRAECVRRKVGAVIVDGGKRILACGYNGVAPGEPSCLLGACPGRAGVEPCISIHAEANAIGHADVLALHGTTMYVTDEPCLRCYRFAGRMGIREVVFPIGPPTLPERREKPEWRACRRPN